MQLRNSYARTSQDLRSPAHAARPRSLMYVGAASDRALSSAVLPVWSGHVSIYFSLVFLLTQYTVIYDR